MTDRIPPLDLLLAHETRHWLPMALLRARETVMARFRPILDAHKINEQQWRVLRVLAERGRQDASEVAAQANILAPSLTRMIRAMSERGLIIRSRDDGDGRRVLLEMAPPGEALVRAISPHCLALHVALEAQYGAERMEALLDLLSALAELPPDR